MKKQLSKVILLMTVLLLAGVSDVCAKKKTLKISVVPSDAQISVDGNYVGDGVKFWRDSYAKELVYKTTWNRCFIELVWSHSKRDCSAFV